MPTMDERVEALSGVLSAWVQGRSAVDGPLATDGLLLSSYGLTIGVVRQDGSRVALYSGTMTRSQQGHARTARAIAAGMYVVRGHETFACEPLCVHVRDVLGSDR
jgi:hypothetical protein